MNWSEAPARAENCWNSGRRCMSAGTSTTMQNLHLWKIHSFFVCTICKRELLVLVACSQEGRQPNTSCTVWTGRSTTTGTSGTLQKNCTSGISPRLTQTGWPGTAGLFLKQLKDLRLGRRGLLSPWRLVLVPVLLLPGPCHRLSPSS